jgi:hypothetical protein
MLYDASYDGERSDEGMNAFGVWGLPWGDWVGEAKKLREPCAGRGGAANSYPWQGDEIVMQLCGQGNDGSDENAVRFALDLPSSAVAAVAPGADMMVMVSKAVFDKEMPAAKVGQIYPIDRHRSAGKALDALAAGGRLYLVTVRPPDDKLWLVAVLDHLERTKDGWVASEKNRTPIADISVLRGKLKFPSAKAAQVLTAADAALLDGKRKISRS